MSVAIRFVLLGNDERLKDPVLRRGNLCRCFQTPLHLSAETADLQKSHDLYMFFYVFMLALLGAAFAEFVNL